MSTSLARAFIAGFYVFFVFSVASLEANPQTGISALDDSPRFLHHLFPDLGVDQMQAVFSRAGLRNTFVWRETPQILPASNSGIDLLDIVMEKKPVQLVEALAVIPYNQRVLTRLDAYNAIGRIENISTYTVYSSSREEFIPLFEESTRLDNGSRSRPIPDPPPAAVLPSSETVYIRLKDTFFGNTFFRGTFSVSQYGIIYNMTNNTPVWFMVFPIMRAERFTAIIYVEPISEGMLIYGVAGLTVPEFLLNRMDIGFQIDRRVSLLMRWLRDGLVAMN